MNNTEDRIRGRVSSAILDKVNRLFRNDDAGVWVELLQNARRAGASIVQVEIAEADQACRITVADNGSGIRNFQSLLTLGESEWSPGVRTLEDPAGMGFFALCHSEVEIHSGRKRTTLTPDVFIGRAEAEVNQSEEEIQGTRICFTRTSSRAHLVAALQSVAEFCPLQVCIGEQVLPQHDFLEGSEYREWIDGVEIGIASTFPFGWSHNDDNWNFYGARLRHAFRCPDGWLTRDSRGEWLRNSLHVRFDVRDTASVKLQLPDRRAIVEDDFLRSFERKTLAAVYRFFQRQQFHALPFHNWKEAQKMGVALPEAAPLLTTWHASPQDEFFDSIFEDPATTLLDDTSNVMLVDGDLPNSHTLEAALHAGASLGAELYKEQPAFQGYSWYDRLSLLCNTAVLLDGLPYEEWKHPERERPKRMEIEVVVNSLADGERKLLLPALIHVDSESINEPTFVAVANSPWDGDSQPGPFSVTDFLMWATFSSSDEFGECDSWETQREEYQRVIESTVNEYFGGPRAALLTLLRDAIPWDAHAYLDRLGIHEIRLTRGTGRRNWQVELYPAAAPAAAGVDCDALADVDTA